MNRFNERAFNFLSWCPGALGLLLRKLFFPRLFRHCGRDVLFGRFLTIRNPGKITIGDHVVISDRVVLDAGRFEKPGPGIVLHDQLFIGVGTILEAGPASIMVRSGANFSNYCTLQAHVPIYIGDGTLLAAFCRVGRGIGDKPEMPEQFQKSGIVIGEGCWVGARGRIEKSLRVGKGAIVGAHAELQASLPDYAIAVGRPAKPIRTR